VSRIESLNRPQRSSISNFDFQVRKTEAIYCLIGFGIGVSCCILYEFIRSYVFTRKCKRKTHECIEHKTGTSFIDHIRNPKTPTPPNRTQYTKKKFQIEDKLEFISFKYCKKSKTLPPVSFCKSYQQQSKPNNLNISCDDNRPENVDSESDSQASGDPVLVYDSRCFNNDYEESLMGDEHQSQYDANITSKRVFLNFEPLKESTGQCVSGSETARLHKHAS
jgi:hypothetical protein